MGHFHIKFLKKFQPAFTHFTFNFLELFVIEPIFFFPIKRCNLPLSILSISYQLRLQIVSIPKTAYVDERN